MSFSNTLARHKVKIISIIFMILFFFAYFFESVFIYVYPGHSGVLFKSLSNEPLQSKTYTEGLYVVAPWNKMYIYNLTKQRLTLDVDALASNGLMVRLRITTIFHPKKDGLIELITHIGENYIDKIIAPTVYSSSREVIGDYLPESLYTTAMHIIQDQILDETKRESVGLPIVVENVVVEKIDLPGSINKAIEAKLKHQQDALAYQYILIMEADEAKRRKIEAESIKKYNLTIRNSLNPEILQWLKVKALADLSKTDNSKVVVLEGNNQTTPVVINPGVQ